MHELGISMARLSALPRRISSTMSNPASEVEHPSSSYIPPSSHNFCVPQEYDKKTDLFHEGRNQGGKLVVIMVGLPGRGKSYMARKVARYLNWINYSTRVFNIGNYRRKLLGADHSAKFFDPDNADGKKQRMEMAEAAMDDMLQYLSNEGEVAIYDGTNSTLERRLWIQDRISQTDGFHLLFIESICEDERIIERNIMLRVVINWYRYPLGESYMDVLSRLEPVIFELERSRAPVVIVAHVEVLRCLYAYFLDLPILDIPNVHAPLNEVIELHTTAYECLERRHVLLPPPCP
ncbi:hypothetical protein DYB28_006876 [Aphanomyces astaci]|uniref:6-phosphofructo-2-kinase domain-containing protein n=2 Tax=Aphanomyces astaci TaxID=112090 RepID=A0A9X8H7M2_APHAT|nr:hypothetical protein DYB28_006876 [Aphanomyces astaci]